MWLIFCIVLLYWCIGLSLLYNLDRGDYEVFDRHERDIIGWGRDRGSIKRDLENDFFETAKTILAVSWGWPFLIYFYRKDIQDARKKLEQTAIDR